MSVTGTFEVVRFVPATKAEAEKLGLRGRYWWWATLPGDASGGTATLTITLPGRAAKAKILRWRLHYLAQTGQTTGSIALTVTFIPWGDPVPRVMGGYLSSASLISGTYYLSVNYGISDTDMFLAANPFVSSGDTFMTVICTSQPTGAGVLYVAGAIEDFGEYVEGEQISEAVGRGLFVSPFAG